MLCSVKETVKGEEITKDRINPEANHVWWGKYNEKCYLIVKRDNLLKWAQHDVFYFFLILIFDNIEQCKKKTQEAHGPIRSPEQQFLETFIS